jgi:hypothetical protein
MKTLYYLLLVSALAIGATPAKASEDEVITFRWDGYVHSIQSHGLSPLKIKPGDRAGGHINFPYPDIYQELEENHYLVSFLYPVDHPPLATIEVKKHYWIGEDAWAYAEWHPDLPATVFDVHNQEGVIRNPWGVETDPMSQVLGLAFELPPFSSGKPRPTEAEEVIFLTWDGGPPGFYFGAWESGPDQNLWFYFVRVAVTSVERTAPWPLHEQKKLKQAKSEKDLEK